LISGEAELLFWLVHLTDVFFREGKDETDPANITKYMNVVRNIFEGKYPEVQILDTHQTV
jgi:hypothetical protein